MSHVSLFESLLMHCLRHTLVLGKTIEHIHLHRSTARVTRARILAARAVADQAAAAPAAERCGRRRRSPPGARVTVTHRAGGHRRVGLRPEIVRLKPTDHMDSQPFTASSLVFVLSFYSSKLLCDWVNKPRKDTSTFVASLVRFANSPANSNYILPFMRYF